MVTVCSIHHDASLMGARKEWDDELLVVAGTLHNLLVTAETDC